jgi:acyl-CoA synthetase (NDP forming)
MAEKRKHKILTMGLDIGSRSAQCVILDGGQLLTYGNVEAGPESAKTAYLAVDAAVHRGVRTVKFHRGTRAEMTVNLPTMPAVAGLIKIRRQLTPSHKRANRCRY